MQMIDRSETVLTIGRDAPFARSIRGRVWPGAEKAPPAYPPK